MEILNPFRHALDSANNIIRSARVEKLTRELEDERREQHSVSTLKSSDLLLSAWINDAVRPNAFVTLLLPFTPGVSPADNRRVRDHHYYLNLWTRKAEVKLWGSSALHIHDNDERCLFFFVRETIRQDWTHDGTLKKFTHYHALCRMPARPTFAEHGTRTLPSEERCAHLQDALITASKTTPEPYARMNSLDHLRGADICVQPYRIEHSAYIFKQLRPRYSEHWNERLDDPLLRDHGLFILPQWHRR